jgi:hypothetical protein
LAKYEQRFTSGMSVLASYTFSKMISDVEMVQSGTSLLQDAANRRSERSVANIDVPHALIASVAYELPIGRGKQFLSSGIASHILGGLAVSGIFTYQSGTPLRITIPNSLPNFSGQLRPNLVGGTNIFLNSDHSSFRPLNALSGERGDVMLNSAAFAVPSSYTYGNLGPYLPWARSFGYANEDISLSKRHALGEGRFFEVRTDWFNAANRSQLNAPVTDLTSANFGRITGQRAARVIQLGARFAF